MFSTGTFRLAWIVCIASSLAYGQSQGWRGDVPSPKAKTAEEKFKLSKDEEKLLELTNKQRKAAGVAPLKINETLVRTARAHSANMARQGKLAHELDGKSPGDRLNDAKYAWSACAENCALGQRTPAEAVSSWMNSAGHRTNLLSSSYTVVGFGIARGADGQLYFTQLFASPLRP